MGEQREPNESKVGTRIGQAVILHRGGDREEARNRLRELWAELDKGGSALWRTTVAHYLAETQDEPAASLAWELRALAEADELRYGHSPHERTGVDGIPEQTGWSEELLTLRTLYPRLHLGAAHHYARLGEDASARRELARARSALRALGDDRYGEELRATAERLEGRLAGGAADS